jgi:hypothetical protein
MSRRVIPEQTEIICDACGRVCNETNYVRQGFLFVSAFRLNIEGFTEVSENIRREYCDMCLGKIEWAISNVVVKWIGS